MICKLSLSSVRSRRKAIKLSLTAASPNIQARVIRSRIIYIRQFLMVTMASQLNIVFFAMFIPMKGRKPNS